jgi:hypothetical protein
MGCGSGDGRSGIQREAMRKPAASAVPRPKAASATRVPLETRAPKMAHLSVAVVMPPTLGAADAAPWYASAPAFG